MSQKTLKQQPGIQQELDEVAIHIRVGDIARQRNSLYGLVPYESYASLIPPTAKTIGIVTAPFKQKRAGWGFGDAELNEAVVTATRDYIQNAFPNAKVTIRNNKTETMNAVYARLVLAKYTICGPSTFCLFPTLASMGEAYIFQSRLFSGKESWLTSVAESHSNIHYVDKRYIPAKETFQMNVTDILGLLAAGQSA